MGVKWTEEQQQVIDLRDHNILVSAAAGSGKTAVLVERIIARLTRDANPVDVDHMLIVTYTEAAAAEMKERIGAAIEKELEEDPSSEHLKRQSALIHTAKITTIHSFCLSVIREYFHTIDLDPGFRIAEEGELKLLKQDVMKELLEAKYEEGNEDFLCFVETFATGREDLQVEEIISRLYEFAGSYPDPEEWLDGCARMYEESGENAIYIEKVMEYIRRIVADMQMLMEKADQICMEPDGPYMYGEMLEADQKVLRKLFAAKSYEEMYEALKEKPAWKTLSRKKDDAVDPIKREQVRVYRDTWKKLTDDIRNNYFFQSPSEMEADRKICIPVMHELVSLVKEYQRALAAKKAEKNLIDFRDMEQFALQILTRKENGKRVPSEVAKEYQNTFEEVMIDEYQDSNLIQEAILTSVSRISRGENNLFMVGDVKQSIYKFRLARPELFMEKYDTYSREESSHQMIELQQNFRSRASVLTCINDIFYQIMTKNLGGIRYTEETALYPGAAFEETEKKAGIPVQFLVADTRTEAFKQLDEEAADYTARELEAKMIAEQIKSFTDEKNGLYVWDKDGQSYRKACYKDMVILLRSMSGWSEVFVNVLMNEGIPATAQTRTGYFATAEVETVLSLLSVIDNPMQDIPMAAVLRSPMVGMTDDEMAWMIAAYKRYLQKKQDRGVYGAWKLWEEIYPQAVSDENPDEDEKKDPETEQIRIGQVEIPKATAKSIWKKLEYFAAFTEELRQDSRYLPVHELLYQIYRKTGYYDYVSSMPAGETRKANLDMLAEKAAAYASTSYRGLFHFVRYIEKLKKYDTDFGEASLGDESNSVRIMSIHKSKGLEFPVVFLAGMGKKFNKQDAYGQLLLDADLGAAADEMDLNLRTKAPTLKKMAIRRRMELESMGEELRVLYVAMTRAKEVLVMTGTDRSLENKLEKWDQLSLTDGQIPYTVLSGANSFLDWVLMAKAAVPAGHMEVKQVQLTHLIGRELQRQLEKKNVKEELLKLDTKQVYDEQMKEQLDQALSYEYPYLEDTGLYTQMSVSELKKQSQIGREEENIGTERKDLSEVRLDHEHEMEPESSEAEDGKKQTETGKKGAFRGTAYHRALECLDLLAVTDQRKLEGDLLDLFQRGFLTEEAYESIFPWDIWKFLESPLGKRMKQAEKEGKLYRERQFMVGIPASEMGKGLQSEELVLIQGVIDAYIEEADGFILIDYKTDYVPKEDTQKGEELLKERYQVQLDYYGRALTQLTGKKVKEKWIYSFGLRKAIQLG